MLLGGTNKTRGKKPKQPADETKGEGEKTRPPSGQDQSDGPNGAQRWNMASSSAESKSDPESLQQQRRRRRQQRPSAVTSNMIHSPALFIAVCASMHVWAYTCVKQKKTKRKVEKGLRRQQLAWEPRGHGGGIDFINRASQHSGSGCSGGAPTGDRKETRGRNTSAAFHSDRDTGATRCRPVRPSQLLGEKQQCVHTVRDKLEHTGKVSKLSPLPDPSGEAPRDLILENICTVGDAWIWILVVTGPQTSAS